MRSTSQCFESIVVLKENREIVFSVLLAAALSCIVVGVAFVSTFLA